MNDYFVLAAIGWLLAIPLILAIWLSPEALHNISRRIAARADALKASRALYKVIHKQAMEGNR